MTAGHVIEILGGIASAAAIVGVLVKISYQLGDFTSELRWWRAATDRRLDGLEAAVYLPRHRTRKRPPDGPYEPPGAPEPRRPGQ